MVPISRTQAGDLLAIWLGKNSVDPTILKQIVAETGYNDSPWFGAERKKVRLAGEIAMANSALVIIAVNQVFSGEDAKTIIDSFLASANKSVFSLLATKDRDFKRRYEQRMGQYFDALHGERLGVSVSSIFMKNLDLDPIKSGKAQSLVAARFSQSLSNTLGVLRTFNLAATGAEALVQLRTMAKPAADHRRYDTKEALAIKMAAVKGDVRAKSFLGRMYFKGEGVPQDYVEATLWLHAASEAGDADAQGLLAMAYEEGLGVSQDYGKAVELYRKAAEQGVDAAAYFLGKLFLEGKGVSKDTTVAAKWFLTSARAGNTEAQGVLIALYMYGEGVTASAEEAYFWALVAARERHPLAVQLSPEIASDLSSEKRTEIDERARHWTPSR